MPLFKYQPVDPPCRICGSGFEIVQRSGDPTLKKCPTCGRSVTLDRSAPISAPQVTRSSTESDAKGAGFKVYKRTSDGSFERQ